MTQITKSWLWVDYVEYCNNEIPDNSYQRIIGDYNFRK
jgi:hypothetical protein